MNPVKLTDATANAANVKDYDNSTSSIVSFGLRNGGSDSEYHLAYRLNEMRELAFELVVKLREKGYDVANSDLETIDVFEPATEEKRISR